FGSMSGQEGLWDWPLQAHSDVVKVHNDDKKFEVHLDAQHFTPTEIEVKVVGGLIDIHAEHTKREGPNGAVARSLTRSYKLPEDVHESAVKSWLSPRGTLVITASKKRHVSFSPNTKVVIPDRAWVGVVED
ncbi:hypothetical protein PENTCL1PPCAC_4722, partial [Pristionchus entomophagus]